MLAKKKGKPPGNICDNKEAKFRYEITERLECGIALVGTEVKSCRQGKINIKDSFARVDKDGQLKLYNCHIARHFTTGAYFNHEETRARVLLANRQEIAKLLKSQEVKGYTLVPLRIYFNDNGFLKCEVGVCKGKNLADKRASIKGRDQGRDMKRELKAAGY